MTVQEMNKTQATGEPVTVWKERSGTVTGLLITFSLCTLLLLATVLNMLSHLEERIRNLEGRVSEMGAMNPAPPQTSN
jgi:hypothetical protein